MGCAVFLLFQGNVQVDRVFSISLIERFIKYSVYRKFQALVTLNRFSDISRLQVNFAPFFSCRRLLRSQQHRAIK